MSYSPRALRRKSRPVLWPYFILPVIATLVFLALFYQSFLYVEKPHASRPHLVYLGRNQTHPVVVEGSESYVSFSFVKEVLDPDVFWDDSGVVVVTTENKVVKLKTDSLTAYVNQHPVQLSLPVILDGNEPYIPGTTLEILYPVTTYYAPEHGTFSVERTDREAALGTVLNVAVAREKASVRARRVGTIEPGTTVQIYESCKGWHLVGTSCGLYGYIKSADLSAQETAPPEIPEALPYVPAPLKGDKVALVWEQVERYTPDPKSIGFLDGVNVVSPTWFRLGETPGKVDNYADSRYVDWAHSRGYQVWALFSNSFELERTRTVLRDSDLRDQVMAQMLVYAEIYSLDGINLDFENVYRDDAPYLTQFVREFTPLLHQQGLTVSIDVTVRSLSPTWSLCYERTRLSETVDYMMLMAYDQYGAGSKVAGPNASIPWTEWAIKTSLEEIPKGRLVLGIPFYARLWQETVSNGTTQITQRALGMQAARDWLQKEGVVPILDQKTGMKYGEKQSGQTTYRIWLEDAESIEKRLQLAEVYDLAGVAAWSRGFEDEETWKAIGNSWLTRRVMD